MPIYPSIRSLAATLALCGGVVACDGSRSAPPVRAHAVPSTAHTLPDVHAPLRLEARDMLCGGRFAEAYGRFVELADEGDVASGRIALVMHGTGPSAFRSEWDAGEEQLEVWAEWSGAAVRAEPASAEELLSATCGIDSPQARRLLDKTNADGHGRPGFVAALSKEHAR